MQGKSIEFDDARDVDADSGPAGALAAIAEPTDGGVEVTFFPADVSEEDALTTWLTVDAESVVDLEAWR